MIKKNLLFIALLILASNARAQETKKSYSYSLEQAIVHALEHNYSVINSGRDIEAARQKKWETTAAGLPQISGTVDYINNFSLQQQGVTGGGPFGGTDGTISTFAFISYVILVTL